MKIKIGDPAPDFALTSHLGGVVRLIDLKGQNIVLYFYPKDETPGCVAEACSFRDAYQAFQEAGAEVLGVSSDTPERHAQFAKKYRLSFPLLSDSKGELRKQYGIRSTFGLIPGRVTFIIDQQGLVRHIFSSQFNPKRHIEEALRVLRELG